MARVSAAVFGNYAATAAAGALVAVLLARFGLARVDAVVIASIVTVLVYLVVLIWAFHAPALGRLWLALAGVAAVCQGLAMLLGPGGP